MPYYPPMTYKMSNELRKFGYKVVHNNDGKLGNLLGSMKDSRKDQEKSGIYKIKCLDCEKEYFGQTKRKLEIREKEHEKDCRRKVIDDKKPLAKHSIENEHQLGPIELVKEVRKVNQLDTYESLYLFKNKNRDLINVQTEGNNPSILYKFI